MTRDEMIQILKDVDARLALIEAETSPVNVYDPNYTINHSVYSARFNLGIARRALERQLSQQAALPLDDTAKLQQERF